MRSALANKVRDNSLVSASIAVHVQLVAPSRAFCSSVAFFCSADETQISSACAASAKIAFVMVGRARFAKIGSSEDCQLGHSSHIAIERINSPQAATTATRFAVVSLFMSIIVCLSGQVVKEKNRIAVINKPRTQRT